MTKPVHVPPYLTQDEVNALPDGTRIVVTWHGGNGPWEYTVERVYFDGDYLYSVGSHTYPWEQGMGILRRVSDLDFVGDKKPHTMVTIAVP
jgi:hypothetical protein